MNTKLIDKPTFIGSIGLLLLIVTLLAAFPVTGAEWIAYAKDMMTSKLGVAYLALGLAALFFMVFVIFSDLGQIKLGEKDEKPEFGLASWAAMLFCGGIGASILYWGSIEWAYYYQNPPFQHAPGSEAAIQWASTYGIFHWGPVAWAIYMIPALPISYFFYVRKQPALKISNALMPAIGERRAKGALGKCFDVMFMFGMLGGAATTLGLAAPLINGGLTYLTGLPNNTLTQVGVLVICTAIFAYSSYVGMEKGIKFLSNINFWGSMGLLLFVFIVGPSVFMLETGLDAIGRMMSNFFSMATWAEPFGGYGEFSNTQFPQDWTIFYWAWWLVFAPVMGLFVARISRGRTIKEMVTGAIFFGSMGCALFFIVLGNYGLSLQLGGQLDVVAILNAQGAPAAIFATLDQLPMSTLVIAVFTLLCVIFTATTFDSISYILAAVVQNNVEEEPMRWNRLFWAFALSFLPAVLMFMGGLSTLQTAAIVGGLPLLVISVLLMISFVRAATLDLREQAEYEDPVIHIEAFPQVDPWSHEGAAFGEFESLCQSARQAVEDVQKETEALTSLKREYFGFFKGEILENEMNELSEQQVAKLRKAEKALKDAIARKVRLSQQAEKAHAEYKKLSTDNDEAQVA
ncbi:choline transporter [Salinivibrio kushneri]|uniref:BCCT family transporter n=1 Tax=Salinivibrio kushneri TaxID=1908198 RepID=UPI00098902AD|nr:BCCT family transporter [Salinivibrio kushneri]OOE37346.1 choline transporter [Salinivibrio kushneri]